MIQTRTILDQKGINKKKLTKKVENYNMLPQYSSLLLFFPKHPASRIHQSYSSSCVLGITPCVSATFLYQPLGTVLSSLQAKPCELSKQHLVMFLPAKAKERASFSNGSAADREVKKQGNHQGFKRIKATQRVLGLGCSPSLHVAGHVDWAAIS